MNYTEKYHLPQWEETDRIMRVDFNQMCADMEAGLTGNAAEAAGAAAEAMAKANEAFRPGNYPYVIGEYTGTGKMMNISLPFGPRFLIVTGQEKASEAGTEMLMAVGKFQGAGVIFLNPDGFTVHQGGSGTYPKMNLAGHAYNYIAFQ